MPEAAPVQPQSPLQPPPPLPPVRMSRMHGKNFGQANFKFNEWSAELDEHQEMEDVFNPRFWVDQSAALMGFDKQNPKGLMDIIHVRKRDAMQYCKLLVVEIGTGYIKTILIEGAAMKAATIPEASPLTTKYNAGRKSHDVVRKADGVVLNSGFQTKAAAAAWIEDHIGKMAG